VIAAQALIVAVAVSGQLSARLLGDDVLLRVRPVDPIDPFRGAYVDLDYPDLPGQLRDPVDASRRTGEVFIPLIPQGEVWVGGALTQRRPDEGRYLRCDDAGYRVRCGIESLFLPQDQAARMQDELSDGAVATVTVDSRGNAALAGVQTP
jgi:uncharacterized membrane-anchored protein